MTISANTARLAKTLSNPNARDEVLVWIDSDENKCCIHPCGSDVYAIPCSKRMALRIVESMKLRGENMTDGFLYSV